MEIGSLIQHIHIHYRFYKSGLPYWGKKELGLCSGLDTLAGRGSTPMIGHLHQSYLTREKTRERLKLYLVKKQQPLILDRAEEFGSFLLFGQCAWFICVQTMLAFVLLHYGLRVVCLMWLFRAVVSFQPLSPKPEVWVPADQLMATRSQADGKYLASSWMSGQLPVFLRRRLTLSLPSNSCWSFRSQLKPHFLRIVFPNSLPPNKWIRCFCYIVLNNFCYSFPALSQLSLLNCAPS